MLQQLTIKDLAIVTALEVELSPGMTALTGETGAGKSILIDALGLLLGDRADNDMIREGASRAEISAVFDSANQPSANDWLAEHELDNGNECILRRILVRNGSSRAFINGSPVTLKSLQQLGEQLVNIHGQHAHQQLLKKDQQRLLLDEYAGHTSLCRQTAEAFNTWHEAQQQLTVLQQNIDERQDRIDMLRYQIEELSRLQLGTDELPELEREQNLLNNAERLIEQCDQAIINLDRDEAGALSLIHRANAELSDLTVLDAVLSEAHELLESAAINITEALTSLRHYRAGVELDPPRLEQLNQRLQAIHDLARKYRCQPEALPERLQEMQQELEHLEGADSRLGELIDEVSERQTRFLELAEQLSNARRMAAEQLSLQVSERMQSLGMQNGVLKVEVEQLEESRATANGMNRIEFMVSTNPGQPPRPLHKVASGGELSRISLAIQVATVSCNQVPTLIFDEVDVGIGGGIAEIVGRLLRQLGDRQQILCVTHLPQVASQGHQHLLVEKKSGGDQTTTQLCRLDGKPRIEEIARMLGGVEMTDQSLAHAKEMVERSTAA